MVRLALPPFLLAACLLLGACGKEGTVTVSDLPPVVVTESVAYTHDGVELEGYLAYAADQKGKAPGVLVIHEWWGLSEHPRERARRLAELGYVAFCPDMYGKGKLTDDPKQAQAWSGAFHAKQTLEGRASKIGRNQHAAGAVLGQGDRQV